MLIPKINVIFMEKKIIFLPTYDYLSIPQLNHIIPKLTDFNCFILHLNDPYYIRHTLKKHYVQFVNVLEEIMINPILEESIKNSKIASALDKLKVFRKFRNDVEDYLDSINPDIVFSLSDKSFGQRITQKWCFKNNTPFIVHQPAFIEGLKSNFERNHPIKNLIYFTRRILINLVMGIPKIRNNAIWGMEYKKSILFLWSEYFNYFHTLSPKKKIFYVGNPSFDNYFTQFNKKDPTVKTVLICTQPPAGLFSEEETNKIDYGYRKLICSYPDIFFYVKVHPRENIEYYLNLFSELDTNNFEVTKDHSILHYIQRSDLQIAVNSFSSMEAAAFGIPIITFVPVKLDDKIEDHYKGEINSHASNESELICIVGEFIEDSNKLEEFYQMRENYFAQYFFSLDGKSAERVAKVLHNISS